MCVFLSVIRIVVQPQSQSEPDGCRLVLTCQAEGPKGMAYQWFKGKEEVGQSRMLNLTRLLTCVIFDWSRT